MVGHAFVLSESDGRPLRVLTLVERSTANRSWPHQVRLLRERNVEVLGCTVTSPGALHHQLAELGCRSFSLHCESAVAYPAAIARFARLSRVVEADVLHVVEPIPGMLGGLGGLAAARGARVFHRQHVFIEEPLRTFCRIGTRVAHLNMAVCEAARQAAIEDDGASPETTAVAYNGVPTPRDVAFEETAALREQLGVPAEAPLVTVVARLRPEKGLDVLLAALARAAPKLATRPHLVIVGTGPMKDDLMRLASAAEVFTTHFLGHQDDVAAWLALGDVVAMPSRREALPFAGAEAMGCARPLVASRVGGLRELVVDGKTGVLVEPEDPDALATGLLRTLSAPSERAQMGREARRRFERLFTVEAMVNGWVECYQRALASTAKSGS